MLQINNLRLANVIVLRSASDSGSPSPSTSYGHASTSSANKYLIGIDRNPAAELLPVIINTPPGNSLLNNVLPLSRDRGGRTLSRSRGDSSISVATRCLLNRIAMSTVGCIARTGPGNWSIIAPSQLLPASVLPTCAPAINTTRCVLLRGDSSSIISRRYGVRSVRHRPGSALDLPDRYRCWSAHSLTVISCSGSR